MPTSTPTFTTESLTQLAKAIGLDTANMGEIVKRLSEMGLSPKDVDDIVKYAKGDIILSQNGTPLGTQLYRKVQINIPEGIGVDGVVTDVNPKLLDSNTTTLARTSTNRAITVSKDATTGKLGFRTVAQNAGSRAAYVFGGVASGVAAVSAGMFLGKMIDESLYNLNPDFWDSVGLSSLNPQRWKNFVFDDDSLGANLFNFLFGIDDEGNTQAYMDEEALAYMAQYMDIMGAFERATTYVLTDTHLADLTINGTVNIADLVCNEDVTINGNTYKAGAFATRIIGGTTPWAQYVAANTYETFKICRCGSFGSSIQQRVMVASESYNSLAGIFQKPVADTSALWSNNGNMSSYTYDNKTVYYSLMPCFTYDDATASWIVGDSDRQDIDSGGNKRGELAWLLVYGNKQKTSGIDGIENQPNATLPDFTGAQSFQDYLDAIRNQYSSYFNNAIEVPSVDPNTGEETSRTYVPVPLPNANNYTDPQPTTGTSTQANPEVNPNTTPNSIIEGLINTIQQRTTQPESDPSDPTRPRDNDNPSGTGEGNTPQIIVPTGSASALWSVYHPSQAQIDSFGAWLWSPSFIDQIAKIFNNPMESIIGLHKVYATPVDAGTSTIHVGYLDSGVSSSYVTQQYVEVDCGTVDLYEQFGNVFDYSPFTTVELYLPFVGIVPLSVDDVMRSQISITYGVDVFTGACLAMVDVQRDLGGGVMYQYSGNCAVQYPISSGSYMGIVAGIASIAGGVAATIATGGGAAPALLGAAGAAMSMHTQVQHSGSFSGNSGAMGGKTPYLIISRPQTSLYGYEGGIEGYPANNYVSVGECSGYVQARKVELIGLSATDTELSMIEDYLLNGVYV